MTDRNYVKNAMNLLTQLKDKYKDELNQNESNYEHMDIVKHKVVINLTNTCLKKIYQLYCQMYDFNIK